MTTTTGGRWEELLGGLKEYEEEGCGATVDTAMMGLSREFGRRFEIRMGASLMKSFFYY